MTAILPTQCTLIEEEQVIVPKEEHYLYFPAFEYNNSPNMLFYRKNEGLEERDMQNIPQLHDILKRFKYNSEDANNICLGSSHFIERFLTAKNILIIDSHLDDAFLRYIEHFFNTNTHCEVQKIEIISHTLKKSQYYDNVLNILKSKNISCKLYIGLSKDIIHDRFILFDEELWHFGGTIGGIQKGLTAFSTGWNNCGLRSLLQQCIKEKYCWEKK